MAHMLGENTEVVLCSSYHRYWETLLEMLWPRFTYIVEMNIESIRTTDPQRLGTIDIRPHYVCISFVGSVYTGDHRQIPDSQMLIHE